MMNTKLIRTHSENPDFIDLVKELDAYLAITDGDEHDFYHQFNGIDVLKHIVLLYQKDQAIGCGAIKHFDAEKVEVKRMYLKKEFRGQGLAECILKELERWASELNYKSCILETGKRQKEAVSFYHKCQYKVIPKYGQYKDMENSICFEKQFK